MSFGASGVRGAKQSSFADAVLHFPAVPYITLDKAASNFVRKRKRRVWSGAFQVGTSPSIQSYPKPSHKDTLCLETSTHPQLLCPMCARTHTLASPCPPGITFSRKPPLTLLLTPGGMNVSFQQLSLLPHHCIHHTAWSLSEYLTPPRFSRQFSRIISAPPVSRMAQHREDTFVLLVLAE